MSSLFFKKLLLSIIDLPELLLRKFLLYGLGLLMPPSIKQKKLKTLSQTAVLIESNSKGLKVISIEVMEGFSVYHGIHHKHINPKSLDKIRNTLSSKLANKEVFVSIEGGNSKMLKVVIQN